MLTPSKLFEIFFAQENEFEFVCLKKALPHFSIIMQHFVRLMKSVCVKFSVLEVYYSARPVMAASSFIWLSTILMLMQCIRTI